MSQGYHCIRCNKSACAAFAPHPCPRRAAVAAGIAAEIFHGGNIPGFTSDAVLANRDADGIDVPLEKLSRQVATEVAAKPRPAP